MNLSPSGLDLIKRFEGLRLRAYQDAVGVWTIGYGTTRGVQPDDEITEAQAEELLRQDVEKFEAAVRECVTVPLSQAQFDALVSFAYNVGAGALKQSTLVRRLNSGDYIAAAQEFARWNMAGGRVLPGLTKRRAAERDLFLSGTTPKEDKPRAPFIAAALPAVVEAVPALIRMFGKGEVTERNAKAAEMVVGVAKEALGVSTEQEMAQRVQADPQARETVRQAVEAAWFRIEEVGGGVKAAREFDLTVMRDPKASVWRSPSFIVALALLPLAYMIVGAVVGLFGQAFSDDVRAAIANGIIGMVIGALSGYYFGSMTSRNRAAVPEADKA